MESASLLCACLLCCVSFCLSLLFVVFRFVCVCYLLCFVLICLLFVVFRFVCVLFFVFRFV